MASYPSAGEVLLRHSSSKNVPAFRPRPQAAVPGTPSVVAAPGIPPGARASPYDPNARFVTASPRAPNLPGAGQYVTVPLKSSTAGNIQRVYAQNVYSGPVSYQQRPLGQQGGQQRPLVGQQQQAIGQPPLYPAYPLLYAQQQQQPQQWQQQVFQQGLLTRAQPLQRQHYAGSHAVHQQPLQQQHSLASLTGDTKRADAEPRFLKSALRSYASSQMSGPSHASSLKSSPSVRFALDEDEVFQKKEGAPEEPTEGAAVVPGVAAGNTPETVGFEAGMGEPTITAAPAAVAQAVSGTTQPAAGALTSGKEELTLDEGTVATEASATPPPAALTGASGRGTSAADATVTQKVATDVEPGTAFAVEEVPAEAVGDQQGKGAEKASEGVFSGTNEQDLVLMYRPVAPPEGESTGAAEPCKMTATISPTPTQKGSSKASQEEKSRSGTEEKREKLTSGGKVSTRDAAAGGRGQRDFLVQRQVPEQSVEQQTKGNQTAGEQEQHVVQPKEEDTQRQVQQAGQGRQQAGGQQQALQREQQPEEGLKQEEQREDKVVEEETRLSVPCLWIGHGDHPHVCLNFSASFQPKLLVRRSSAPALHVYGDEQLPVKDYFVVATPVQQAATAERPDSPTLAPSAVEQAALTAAVTAGSKARPAVTAVPHGKTSEQEDKAKVGETAKPQVVREAEEQGKMGAQPIHKAERDLTAPTDSGAAAPEKDISKTAEGVGGAAAGRGAPPEGVTRTQDQDTHGLSRRDWSILSSFFSFSPSAPRSPSVILRLGSLPFEMSEKGEQVGSRRDSNISTSDGLSADEVEWRLEMARPTILLHRPFQHRDKPQQDLAAAGGSATTTETAAVKSQRLLIVVDTTTEWWPSVQVRWVDGKKTLQDLQEQQQKQQQAEPLPEGVESIEAEAQNAENERLIRKGHPTNFAGICIWSNHRPTVLDRRT